MSDRVDAVVIGAGVLGCALAARLADGKTRVVLLEAGPRIAEGVTSRNSGVIHSGLYYAPGSLKAETCVRGNRLLYEWCAKKGVAHAKTGKLVLARGAAQLDALAKLEKNARALGAPGIEIIGRDGIREKEPAIDADAALWCPETGIVDATELARSLMIDAESRGAMVLTNARVTALAPRWRVETTRGPIDADRVFNCAGLHADEVARLAGIDRWRIHPCRGDYFTYASPMKYQRLLYPVKDPTSPGLGVHFTLDTAGRYRFGPDAEYVERKDDFSSREDKLDAFHAAAEKLLGVRVDKSRIAYDTCGIRPKLRAPSDPDEKDFVVAEDPPGLTHFVGIESPGLTSALALAELVTSSSPDMRR